MKLLQRLSLALTLGMSNPAISEDIAWDRWYLSQGRIDKIVNIALSNRGNKREVYIEHKTPFYLLGETTGSNSEITSSFGYISRSLFRSPIIYYDPQVVAMFGEDAAFLVVSHEWGHLVLHHHRKQLFNRGKRAYTRHEVEADCYGAALTAKREKSIEPTIDMFSSQYIYITVDKVDLTLEDRASIVSHCYKSAEIILAQ
ncbi:hypothetical protein COV16_05860 [Candidatus Woesearchaeota archaeon CG10_big_fil_rev_8_21_14_0_10_34_8]|nr:MAG: hypothetical protein COV16_05860 [Candidatus Woesearchaeota archaeon CG10_big_fil_rev_8_21_14_0_10_34_8]